MSTVSWIFVGLFFICHYHERNSQIAIVQGGVSGSAGNRIRDLRPRVASLNTGLPLVTVLENYVSSVTASPSKCLRHQFKCLRIRQCIPLHRRCDGRSGDCGDGSDEKDCTKDSAFRCPRGDHRCGNSRCVPNTWVCDGETHCQDDRSDEKNCDKNTSAVCLKNEFPCGEKKCIPMSKRCDGVPGDCPDKISDEFGCDERRCPEREQHRCGSGLCLSSSLVCDGEVHCNDGSDEENCHTCETWGCSHYCVEESHGPRCLCEKGFKLSTQDERTCMATCLRNEFRCSDGEQCVPMLHRCDGEDNCRDRSDESGCEDFACPEYRCGNGRQCMPESYVCDGWRHCDDGSDEKDCAPVPFSGSTEYNSSCLRNQFRCPEGTCIPLHWRCDGEPDCSSDEVDCGSRTCPAGYHRCSSNGQCISGLLACDRVEDCADGSDEENCGITVENCGKSIVPSKAVYRISGGRKAEHGKYPWMISLQEVHGIGFHHICGGAVLNENWIVTAAHCIDYFTEPYKYRILAGLHKLSRKWDSTVQKIKVAKIFLHKEFDNVTYENDIALLKTTKPIDLIGSKGYINGICLPRMDKEARGFAKVIGWGHPFQDTENSDTLKEVVVPIIPRDLCNESYDEDPEDDDDAIKKTMICAGMAKRDSCDNDSGGPLFQTSRSGVSTLIGVVSHGAGCGEKMYPGVYTKVSAYKKWMKKIMLK